MKSCFEAQFRNRKKIPKKINVIIWSQEYLPSLNVEQIDGFYPRNVETPGPMTRTEFLPQLKIGKEAVVRTRLNFLQRQKSWFRIFSKMDIFENDPMLSKKSFLKRSRTKCRQNTCVDFRRKWRPRLVHLDWCKHLAACKTKKKYL